MYGDDSFYTLNLIARLGLLAVSAALTLMLVLIACVCMRRQRGPVRVAIATLLFSIFVWVSPQIYYEYYQLIFNGLPRQWVIVSLPAFNDLLGLITFMGPQTLSAHTLGALFWILIWLAWRLRIRPQAAMVPDPDHQ